jgi:prevent-host-death family protein
MKSAGIFEVKEHFSHWIAEVEKGEEIMITRRGRPVAKLLAVNTPTPQQQDIDLLLKELKKIRQRAKASAATANDWKALRDAGRR